MDLKSEHERFLAEKVFKRPVFLYDYPKKIKAFYMKVSQGTSITQLRRKLRASHGHVDSPGG